MYSTKLLRASVTDKPKATVVPNPIPDSAQRAHKRDTPVCHASTTVCTLKTDDAVKSLPSIFSLGPVTVSSSLIKIHRSITRQWERKIQDGTQH